MDERFLIIDTAHRQGLVAVAEGAHVLEIRHLQEARRHARELAPLVQELLHARGWKARDLNGVIVSRGPGSYTGLRVGLISAKTLAFATGCVLVGIDTFPAIARQPPPDAEIVDVLADAQQGKVYVQRFVHGQPEPLRIEPFAAWRCTVKPRCWVTGPGLEIHSASVPEQVRQAPEKDWLPRPESLLAIALERRRRGEQDDPFTLEPLYLRASSAEEKRRSESSDQTKLS